MYNLVDRLENEHILAADDLAALISGRDEQLDAYLFRRAVEVQHQNFGANIYIRGLIELSSYCRNDCLYCGIRCSNRNAQRYRLNLEQVLDCCRTGYELGFRTFVLQGGDDPYFNDARVCTMVASIKDRYPDCALTLSLGEKSYTSYRAYRHAGADRYLLRHESAVEEHYLKLHPASMSLAARKECLFDLKQLGFQVGCGFMVGSPYQRVEHLVHDLLFIHRLQPHMVGIGPFIPHQDTPFANQPAGSMGLTRFMLALLRLMLPSVLLPATTALGTIHPEGRELGILAGANVVMPNLSPPDVRSKYLLYDNKLCTEDEAAEGLDDLQRRLQAIGYRIVVDRGDYQPAA
ncbi:MAG: [FeFe] hydrogenase H-cluster radical SAM maturase HydE [Syntrophomonadaceae bacterium]